LLKKPASETDYEKFSRCVDMQFASFGVAEQYLQFFLW
jgi:hypothetical protein